VRKRLANFNVCALPAIATIAMTAAAMCTIACGRQAPPAAEAEELEGLSVTRWTGKTELFAEYPPLIAGQTSRFAIHLTRLDTFKALTAGHVEVQLRGGGAAPETFAVDAPSRPGIFGVDVKPARAGSRELVIVLRSRDLNDEQQVGPATVHPNAAAARADATRAAGAVGAGGAAGGGEAPGISFLKEQQWSLDFATALVQEKAVRDSIRVPASIEARTGGAADVVAPIDGRLMRVADAPPGTAVSRGQELARLLPPPSIPGDLPQLRRAQTEAASALALATRDRERAERLTTAGAAPQKRLDEARATEEQAKARAGAADASLAQYNAARTGAAAADDGLFIVRAPIAGVIARRTAATSGANVTAGTQLFQVVDASAATVVGHVPEADAIRARRAQRAEIEVRGDDVRGEGARDAAGRPDADRVDAGRADAGRGDAGRADAGRADAGRADAGRADAGRADAGRADGGRADADRPDAGRAGPGREDIRLPVGKLIGVGKVLDASTRTLPMTFAFDNRGPSLPIGQSLFLHLLLDETSPHPAVPAGAVVDDAGRPIVFVQREGETFERRAVTLGPRAGDLVQVIEGLKPGERVVTKGAYLVRLASLSTTVPAHGHVH
jgi:multidrug efflux pump subunit AcrA (membrane-fusion protein)